MRFGPSTVRSIAVHAANNRLYLFERHLQRRREGRKSDVHELTGFGNGYLERLPDDER
jgi:hypothetical protein